MEKKKFKFAPIEPMVFYPAVIIVAIFGGIMALFPELSSTFVDVGYAFVMQNMTAVFLWVGLGCLGACLWLAFGRFGRVRLGGPEDKPEFSTFAWVSMMFCCGIGSGILIWGIVEPIYYFGGPPAILGIEPQSDTALLWAHMLPQFHWGITAWAIYCLPAVPIAYSVYVRKEKIFRISDACRSLLKDKADGPLGKFIELVVLLGTVGAVGTTLGLAIPLMSKLVSAFTGIADTMGLKWTITIILFILFGGSSYLGIHKGMQNLTRFNVWLAFFMLGLIVLVGPTNFILDTWTNSIGLMINYYPILSTQSEPLRLVAEGGVEVGWAQAWTVFYWAWFVAYAPITALFVARISRGRTIRAVVICECFFGALGCWLFQAILGACSLYAQKTGLVDTLGIQAAFGDPSVCVEVMKSLPLGWLMLPIYALLALICLSTSMDAFSQSLANMCSQKGFGDLSAPRWSRMVWATLLALFGMGILITGGEEALKTVETSCILGGVILVPILVIVFISVVKSLKEDFGDSLSPKQIISPAYYADRPSAAAADNES